MQNMYKKCLEHLFHQKKKNTRPIFKLLVQMRNDFIPLFIHNFAEN